PVPGLDERVLELAQPAADLAARRRAGVPGGVLHPGAAAAGPGGVRGVAGGVRGAGSGRRAGLPEPGPALAAGPHAVHPRAVHDAVVHPVRGAELPALAAGEPAGGVGESVLRRRRRRHPAVAEAVTRLQAPTGPSANSPGRQAWVWGGRKRNTEPRRGDTAVVSPLRGSGLIGNA